MASIRKRGRSWQAQVRSRKTGSIGKSFHRKVDAERWAIEQEALMQNGRFAQLQTQDLTLHDLMETYLEKVTPAKKGAAQEFRRIFRSINRSWSGNSSPWVDACHGVIGNILADNNVAASVRGNVALKYLNFFGPYTSAYVFLSGKLGHIGYKYRRNNEYNDGDERGADHLKLLDLFS